MRLNAQGIQQRDQHYFIRTTVPREDLTDASIAHRAKNHGIHIGDSVEVQIMDAGYDKGQGEGKLLFMARYLVIERSSKLVVHGINDYKTRQNVEVAVRVQRIGDWMAFNEPEVLADEFDRRRVWNPVSRTHEVYEGDSILFDTRDKAEAEAVVAGGPVPVAA